MTIEVDRRGKCPHCNMPNRFEKSVDHQNLTLSYWNVENGLGDHYKILKLCRCTNCGENIIIFDEKVVYPIGFTRSSAPNEVPTEIGQDFNEACLVESLSKKASAALARRCLQSMLHEQGITKANLSLEIDKAMENLPSHLSKAIDAIRNIGNFATHPIKSTNTGEIVDVEEGETEWILNVLEQLFDFYYVQPAITQAKKSALNIKLKSAGKPEMK